MTKVEDYWVNVDFPLRSCTLHSFGCIHEIKKADTAYKGIRTLKRDGGWLPFGSEAEAEAYCRAEFPDLAFKRCSRCYE